MLRKSSLIKDDNGDFVWTDLGPSDESPLTWIDRFQDGLSQLVQRRRASFSRGALLVQAAPRGFEARS